MIRNRNRKIVLAARPSGLPAEDDFRLVEEALPEPGPGQVHPIPKKIIGAVARPQ